jgi:hypothetical protein
LYDISHRKGACLLSSSSGIVVRVPLLSSTIVVLVRLLEIKGVLILVLLEAGDANAIFNDKTVSEELLRLNSIIVKSENIVTIMITAIKRILSFLPYNIFRKRVVNKVFIFICKIAKILYSYNFRICDNSK